jgi:hypothetical protein
MAMRTARWWDPRTWMAFMFWELRRIFAAISGDAWSEWKAAVSTAVYLGRRLIDKGSPFIFLVVFAVGLINTPTMMGKFRRWRKLSTEFEDYSAPTRIAGGIVVLLLYVGAIVCAGHFGEAQHNLPP